MRTGFIKGLILNQRLGFIDQEHNGRGERSDLTAKLETVAGRT